MRGRRAWRHVDPAWLFPATYVIHLFEEYFAAGGFPAWTRRVLGLQLSDAEFVAWNALGLVLMCVGALLAARSRRLRFVEVALATAVLGNAVAHALSSVATSTYSPGLVTGLALWVPIALIRLRAASRLLHRRGLWAGISIGAAATAVTLAVVALRAAG